MADRNVHERFAKHSSLWLTKVNGTLAGYGWTLHGTTIEPYFLDFAQEDVHLFDFHVFPEYRGQGLNPLLVNYILGSVACEEKRAGGRIFIDVAEWNTPQLSSLRKTPFRQIAWVRKSFIRRHPIVSWTAGIAHE